MLPALVALVPMAIEFARATRKYAFDVRAKEGVFCRTGRTCSASNRVPLLASNFTEEDEEEAGNNFYFPASHHGNPCAIHMQRPVSMD